MSIKPDPEKFKNKLLFIFLWHILFLILIKLNPVFELTSVQATNIMKFMQSLDFNYTIDAHNTAFYTLMISSYYLISYFILKVFLFFFELIYFLVIRPLLARHRKIGR